eukprot:364612-Chlamydomonas_euryale.AAC.6
MRRHLAYGMLAGVLAWWSDRFEYEVLPCPTRTASRASCTTSHHHHRAKEMNLSAEREWTRAPGLRGSRAEAASRAGRVGRMARSCLDALRPQARAHGNALPTRRSKALCSAMRGEPLAVESARTRKLERNGSAPGAVNI